MTKPHTVALFGSNSTNIIPEEFGCDWIEKVTNTISSIKQLHLTEILQEHRNNTSEIEQDATVCSKKLLNRLHGFLRSRVPLQRVDLFPGRHWVWDSLRSKLTNIFAMMILSRHVVDYDDVKYRNDDE